MSVGFDKNLFSIVNSQLFYWHNILGYFVKKILQKNIKIVTKNDMNSLAIVKRKDIVTF